MDLALSDDQRAILEALDSLCRAYESATLHGAGFALTSAALDQAVADGGFLDVGLIDELGAETPALVVERLARLPQTMEAAMSALVRPLLDPALPRPLCLIEEGALHRPVRFLQPGASVVVVGATVRSFSASAAHVAALAEAPLYAYPMARLMALPADMCHHDVAPGALRARWRVALAAEGAGLLAGALASVTGYISQRKQFGRPLATFQALRHRMAEAQVLTNGAYWLALKAARTGDPGDAALAALHVQDAARKVTYDYHQFLGAMGMTLEHPLHLWTYRLKGLIGELGGRGAQGLAAADALWGDRAAL